MTERDLIEQLADKEHDGWARWMAYLFTQCGVQPDGALLIPAAYVDALSQQIDKPYADLSEREKQYDREEVALILPIIRQYAQSAQSRRGNDHATTG